MKALSEENSRLVGQGRALMNDNSRLLKLADDLSSRNKKLLDHGDALSTDIVALSNEVNRLSKVNEDLSAYDIQLLKRGQVLSAENNALLEEIDVLWEKYSALSGQCGEMDQRLEMLLDSGAMLGGQMQACLYACQSFKAERDDLRMSLNEANRDGDALKEALRGACFQFNRKRQI